MATPRVIDLSHHNTVPKDFIAAKNDGIVGVIHKLTEGSSYVDDKVAARYYLAKQAGLAWGLYHFMRPGDMKKQAEFFIKKAYELEVIDEQTVLVADHEDASVPGQDLKKWLDYVEDRMGRSPVVYSGHVLKDQLAGSGYRPKRRLWLCHYASKPVLPEGVDKYWMWQYTDKGSIGGLSPIDLNDIGNVDMGEFLNGWAGSHDTIPAPEPVPPTVIPRITISSSVPIELHIGPNVTVK